MDDQDERDDVMDEIFKQQEETQKFYENWYELQRLYEDIE